MNEELTNEVLEEMKKCRLDCPSCSVNEVCSKNLQALATALLEERAKPKVWDGAPEWAKVALVGWYENNEQKQTLCCKCYTRELPKSRARQIAENIVHGINGETHGETKDIEYVEGVLKRYAEELEGKE